MLLTQCRFGWKQNMELNLLCEFKVQKLNFFLMTCVYSLKKKIIRLHNLHINKVITYSKICVASLGQTIRVLAFILLCLPLTFVCVLSQHKCKVASIILNILTKITCGHLKDQQNVLNRKCAESQHILFRKASLLLPRKIVTVEKWQIKILQ